jgi:hypothetical protein
MPGVSDYRSQSIALHHADAQASSSIMSDAFSAIVIVGA